MGCSNCKDGDTANSAVSETESRRKIVSHLPPAFIGYDKDKDEVVLQVGNCPLPCALTRAVNCQKLYMWVKHAYIVAGQIGDPFYNLRDSEGHLPTCERCNCGEKKRSVENHG